MSTSNDYAPGYWGTCARDWCEWLAKAGHSSATAQVYGAVVRRLGIWAHSEIHAEVTPFNVRAYEIREYLAQFSKATADLHYKALRSFYRYLVRIEGFEYSPMGEVRLDVDAEVSR